MANYDIDNFITLFEGELNLEHPLSHLLCPCTLPSVAPFLIYSPHLKTPQRALAKGWHYYCRLR